MSIICKDKQFDIPDKMKNDSDFYKDWIIQYDNAPIILNSDPEIIANIVNFYITRSLCYNFINQEFERFVELLRLKKLAKAVSFCQIILLLKGELSKQDINLMHPKFKKILEKFRDIIGLVL